MSQKHTLLELSGYYLTAVIDYTAGYYLTALGLYLDIIRSDLTVVLEVEGDVKLKWYTPSSGYRGTDEARDAARVARVVSRSST